MSSRFGILLSILLSAFLLNAKSMAADCLAEDFEPLSGDNYRYVNGEGIVVESCEALFAEAEGSQFSLKEKASSSSLRADVYLSLLDSSLYGKPIKKWDEDDYCIASRLIQACEVWGKKNTKSTSQVIGYLLDRKSAYSVLVDRKPEMARELERIDSENRALVARREEASRRWGVDSCAAQKVSGSLEIRGGRLGSVCALGPELLDSTVASYYRYEDALSIPFRLPDAVSGMTLREAISVLRDTAKSMSGDVGIVGVVGAAFEVGSGAGERLSVSVWSDIEGSDVDSDVIVWNIRREFCAKDPTNSVGKGSSFRGALLSKYGDPRFEYTGDQMFREVYQEAATQLPLGIPNREQRLAFAIAGDERARLYSRIGKNSASLVWQDSSGAVLKIAERPPLGCKFGNSFAMTLDSDHHKSWLAKIKTRQANAERVRAGRALVPDL